MINKEILKFIEKGYSLVVPTQGLAHHLQSQYAAQQIQQGLQTWPSINIHSWNVWLLQLWQQQSFYHENPPSLLSRHQSLLLWTKVIESSKYAKHLLQTEATARQVQSAYSLMNDWNIESIPDDYFMNQDVFAFKVWKESYELRCKSNNWLDEANLIDYLQHSLNPSNCTIKKYVCYAFDDLKPKQRSFLDFLSNQGLHIDYLMPVKQNTKTEKIAFEDELQEVNAIANWIIDCYKQNAEAKIGIILPNLNTKKTVFQTELTKRLSIKQYLDNTHRNKIPFTISLGKSLNEYSMIRIALTILSLNPYRIDLDRLSLILRSIHITEYQNELNQRHVLDAELKKLGQSSISFQTITNIHQRLVEENQCPIIIEKLTAFFAYKQENINSRNLREWPSIFTECLKIFLWPGDEQLNSEDYQTWEAWKNSLEHLSSLNIINNKHDFEAAVNLLSSVCGQIQFQPKTEDKNIYIMGVEGASGMQFDHCWFANLSDQTWPQNYLANPFIPLQLQRELEIPGSSANINLQDAKQITKSLVEASKNMVLSYSMREEDSELRPSPLLKNITSQTTFDGSKSSYDQTIFNQKSLEYIEIDSAPKIAANESINGSTALFKDQAACPFKAFAKHRLNADSLSRIDIGLNAIDRGIIIHRVLQLFWDKIKHSDQLRRLSEEVLNQRINEVVSSAIEEQTVFLDNILQGRFIEIEHERLCRALRYWIEIEKQREAFTVDAVEKGHHILFNGITLHMRIDRIDQLEDGRLLIIDYKTGDISQNAWFGERPEDPQLPLYAITTDGEVAGLAFAKLKVGDYRYLGISDTENLLPKIKALSPEHWQQSLKDWQANLANLALEFKTGDARVDPIPGACRYCDLPSLCRINERVDVLAEEDE